MHQKTHRLARWFFFFADATMPRIMALFSFLGSLLRHPRTIGTLSPASPFTAKRVADALPAGAKRVLELGAGDGALTREILKRLPPDGRLLAVELRPELARALEALGDPRLTVFEGDARQAREEAQRRDLVPFDVIVSSLPFALFDEATRAKVLDDAHDLLAPGGVLIVCQHAPTLLPELKRRFEVDTSFEPLNLPPYFVMRARRRS